MTTTAHEDQFTTATQTIEPVRQLYDTAAILRRNVAELELALKQQMERAEAAEEKLTTAREDMQSWIDSRNGWMERAGAAEAELAKMREQEPVAYVKYKATGGNVGLSWVAIPTGAFYPREGEQLYAAPVPAPAVAVPDATCKQCLQVDRELREVIAGLVAIAEKKGKRQGSPNHCHQRPGIWDDDNGDLAGKPCSECAIYDRARALLQSAPQPTIGDK